MMVVQQKTRVSPDGDHEGESNLIYRRGRQDVKEVAIGSLTNETEYGDASACLCLSHPVDPTRPAAP